MYVHRQAPCGHACPSGVEVSVEAPAEAAKLFARAPSGAPKQHKLGFASITASDQLMRSA